MKETIAVIVLLIIGAMILGAGIYYFLKEKEDAESRKIYGIAAAIGLVICVGVIVKILIAGI